MTNSLIILAIVAAATLLGDYFIKVAKGKPEGMASAWFVAGAATYGLLAFGWYLLMKSNSLATIAVMFSASIILLLTALGHFVFKEPFGVREGLGVSLAVLSVVVMNPR